MPSMEPTPNGSLQRTKRARRARLAAGLAAALLAACSSAPPPRFHTLMPAGPLAAQAIPDASGLAWQMPPIGIPAQVDQPQFVLRRADNTLAVLEQERWIAPLQDDLRAALVEHLSAQIGPPGAKASRGRTAWRVMVEVRRLEATPGRTLFSAQWALLGAETVAGAAPALRCVSQFEHATGPDIPALAQGHRLAVQQLAQAVAAALVKADTLGQGIACP